MRLKTQNLNIYIILSRIKEFQQGNASLVRKPKRCYQSITYRNDIYRSHLYRVLSPRFSNCHTQ